MLALAVLGFEVNSFAQVSASSSAKATIVTTINLVIINDINFGNIPNASVAGKFILTGLPYYTYSITIPLPPTVVTNNSKTNTMIVDSWSSNPAVTGILDGSGSQTLTVGATLHIANDQVPDLNISAGQFNIVVNYN